METLLDLRQPLAERQVGPGTGIVMDEELIAAKKGESLQMIATQMHRPFKCNCTARIMQPSNEHLLHPPHPTRPLIPVSRVSDGVGGVVNLILFADSGHRALPCLQCLFLL